MMLHLKKLPTIIALALLLARLPRFGRFGRPKLLS